jgi:aminopeptidase N
MAKEIAAAMEFFSGRFGAPPLKRLEVSPLPGHFGQGFPGLIYLSTLSYLPPTSAPVSSLPLWQQVFYGELLRAHEAAHQWWGNLVVTSSYHNEWITEALANYSALMFLESRKGPKFTDMVLSEYRKELLAKAVDGSTVESSGSPVDGQRLNNSVHPNAWEAVAYGKGAWIFHMLRRRMGDASFNRMLAELRRRYEYKSLDTESLRLLCAEFLPAGSPDPKLENFFDQWVYGTGIPALKVSYSVKGAPGAYRLTGSITQSDVSADFSVIVPVEIQTGKGKVIRQIRSASDPVPFSIPVSALNAKAVLDPGQSVLRH